MIKRIRVMEFPYAGSLPDANKQVISCVLFLFVLVVKKLC